MHKTLAITAAVAVCCFANNSTLAAQPFPEVLTPNITLGFQFGHAERNDRRTRFTAQFDVQSRLFQAEGALASSTQSAMPLSASRGVVLLSVFEVGANRHGFDSAHVFGHDLLETSKRLNETGESSSNSWIWWTVGGVAVAAGAVLATAGHSGSNDPGDTGGGDEGGGGGGGGNCVGVTGGDIGSVPNIDNSGCPGGVPSVP